MADRELYLVLVTTSSEDEAAGIAEHLVGERLAACVNIVGPIRSIYLWEGNLQRDTEYLLVIKTAGENFTELEQAVRKRHSYAVPEVVALRVAKGSKSYLDWALGITPGQTGKD